MEESMKKLVISAVALVAACGALWAFDPLKYPPPVAGGNLLVDVSVGYAGAYGFTGSGVSLKIPPLSAGVEYALPSIPLSVGGMIAFYQYGYDWSVYSETWTYVIGGARANWHWGLDVPWLDLYTGIFLGYRYFKWSYDGPTLGGWYAEPSYGGLAFGGQVGAHFYFTKTIGALVEAGYPFLIKAGLALKF
jgi:hypothetical protein